MKLILTILILISSKANAVTYYVSSSDGNDSDNGITEATAWLTIAKVNASTFAAGDNILFKKGDSWNERLNPPSSGSAGSVITFGAYGTGLKPIITGFQTLALSDLGSNIWSATATSSVLNQNTVLINGKLGIKARYPNASYLTFSAINSTTQLTGTLSGTPNYTGFEIVVRVANWVLDVSKVASQSGGVLNFSPAITYGSAIGGTGYFFQNEPSLLDSLNEWVYDSTTKLLSVYATSSPTIQYSTIDTLVYLSNVSYVTFDGIKFTGSNKAGIEMNNAFNCIIQNCVFDNHGANGISETFAPANTKVGAIQVLYDTITNCLSNGYYSDPDTSIVVNYNYIKNIGLYAGMGKNGSNSHTGIYNHALTGTIAKPNMIGNVIDSCGYNGIRFRGKNSVIKNNYITNFCFIKDDGGGVYTFGGSGDQTLYAGSIVRKNIIKNGIGAGAGAGGVNTYAHGIYFDEGTRDVTTDSNTVYNTTSSGVFLHAAANITLKDNTVLDTFAVPLAVDGFYSVTFGLNFKRNILFSKSASKYIFNSTYKDSTNTFIDSNYYLRPVATANSLHMGSVTSQLPEWFALTGYDGNSHGTPSGITSAEPLIYFNPTFSGSTVSLNGTYVDAKGVYHYNSIVLNPFSSAILFTSSTQPAITRRAGGFNFSN